MLQLLDSCFTKIPPPSDPGAPEKQFINDIVKNVNKEISIESILIMKRQEDLTCHLNDFNAIGLPTFRFDESTKIPMKDHYNSETLAMVCMSEIKDITLLSSLAVNVNRMRETRIIVWLQTATPTSSVFFSLIGEKVTSYKFVNLLVFHLQSFDNESIIIPYRLQPFPSVTFQRIANIYEGPIFPKIYSNFHEKTAIILPDYFSPRKLLLSNYMQRKIIFTSPLDFLIIEFSKQYNISLTLYPSSGKCIMPEEARNLTINGSLDLPLRFFSEQPQGERILEYPPFLEIGRIFFIVPCEKEMTIKDVYTGLRTCSSIILGAYFMFAVLETIIVAVTFRMFRGRFQLSYSTLLINLRAFGGVLGLSIQLNRYQNSLSLKQIVMVMSLFGIIFSSLFNANLSTLLIKQPRLEMIQSFEQLRNSELQLLINKDLKAYIERDINADFFKTIVPNIKLMEMNEQKKFLIAFDTNYAYILYPTMWDALEKYQQHFNRKVMCNSKSMRLANDMPVSGILTLNSIYKVALTEYIYRCHSHGLYQHWRTKTGDNMISSINSMKTPQNSEEIRPLTMDDLKWVWKLIAWSYGVAGIVFVLEIFIERCQKGHNNKILPTKRIIIHV